MKSLVTGGAGFIGSNLVDGLLDMGHEVVVIDNEYSDAHDHFYWNDRTENYKFDIRDYENTRPLYDGVDYVFHIAAEARIQPAVLNPVGAVSINSVGTCTVLQCAREAKVKKLMYSSTSAAYGMNSQPNVETQPDDCLNPYSASKIAGEKFCKMYTNLYGLETVTLRYFNVFGNRSPRRGQYAPVIGIFQRQKEADQPLTIVGDGSQRRDFIHVKDVARANYLAATLPLNGHEGEVFNVGSGKAYSIQQIADSISDNQVYIDKRSGEMQTTFADITKIGEVIGWKPEIDVIDWINGQKQISI